MKKRLIIALVLTVLISAFAAPAPVRAAQFMCFTAVNDKLLPLSSTHLPAYFGTTLYVPGNIFTLHMGLVAGYNQAENRYYLYRNRQDRLRLDFYIDSAETFDDTGQQYLNQSAQFVDDTLFLPLELVCDYFGFTYSVIPSEPASVLRIKNTAAITNDKTFLGLFREDMRKAYEEYFAPVISATPTVPPSPTVTTSTEPTYESVTLYFSFYSVSVASARRTMDALETQGLRGCFYLTGYELIDEPAIAREIAGRGHTVGIWLTEGSYDEYKRASELLFETAKLKTPIIAAPNAILSAAEQTAEEHGLILRGKVVSYDPARPEHRVPTGAGIRVELRTLCGELQSRSMTNALSALLLKKYTVKSITETSPEVNYG